MSIFPVLSQHAIGNSNRCKDIHIKKEEIKLSQSAYLITTCVGNSRDSPRSQQASQLSKFSKINMDIPKIKVYLNTVGSDIK